MTKTIVVPGELISDKAERGSGIYTENEKTLTYVIGSEEEI